MKRFDVHAHPGVLRALSLVESGRDAPRGRRRKKYDEVSYLLPHLIEAIDAAGDRPVNVLDCGVGKGYVTFLLDAALDRREITYHGVDRDREIIATCRSLAEQLCRTNLAFTCGRVDATEIIDGVFLSYSLHACDTATDDAIAAGIRLGAERIIAVPCCQKSISSQLDAGHAPHGLGYAIGRFGLVRDRIAATVTDAFRAMALSACGYEVWIGEFAPHHVTPKNTMIRATRAGRGSERARREFAALRAELGLEPEIGRLLEI